LLVSFCGKVYFKDAWISHATHSKQLSSTKISPSNQTAAGLPDFSWYVIPKPEKNVPNQHKMYQMVIKFPKGP
jgi:hypothetical protein